MTTLLVSFLVWAGQSELNQVPIPRVSLLPDRPTPYHLRDWQQTALDYDQLVFDESRKGQYLPLIWRLPNQPNVKGAGFGIPTFVGHEDMRGKPGESIAAMGSLLGATAVGLNKRRWVEMMAAYYSDKEGLVLNNVGTTSGQSFWYELLPCTVFTQLASRYPTWKQGRTMSRNIADTWITAMDQMKGNFDHTSFNIANGKQFDNRDWVEPDAVAAVAYLELFESLRTRNPKYRAAAQRAISILDARKSNPMYEILMPYGALAGAYLNAHHGTHYRTGRNLDWSMEPTSPNRTGWGMVVGRWGGYDVGGLMGSTTDGGGYPFAMNTFLCAATMAPIARYEDQYSAAIGKWILNLANASRLFYRDGLPLDHQSSGGWKGDPKASIAYEALHRTWNGKSPYASGDAKRSGWAKEDFGLYGGGYVGLLGALVHPTNVPMILRLDLRATDYLMTPSYPTSLYWNPYEATKTVNVELGARKVRIYDAVGNRFLSESPQNGAYRLRLHSKQAVQLVAVPATGAVRKVGKKSLIKGVVIDFNNLK